MYEIKSVKAMEDRTRAILERRESDLADREAKLEAAKAAASAAQEAAEYERAWVADQEADQLQAIKDNGVEVVEDPDIESFREAVQSVYDAYPQYADYISRIQETLAQ